MLDLGEVFGGCIAYSVRVKQGTFALGQAVILDIDVI